jgi:hypothetical protein
MNCPTLFLACLSDAYFQYDANDRWYIPYELASELIQIHKRNRTIDQTMVVCLYIDDDRPKPKNALEAMAKIMASSAESVGRFC